MKLICSLCLVFLAIIAAGCGGVSSAERMGDHEKITVTPIEAYRQPCRTEVASGDTVESVCRRMAGPDWVLWRDAILREMDPRQLRPGTVFDGVRSTSGRLEAMTVSLNLRSQLELGRSADAVSIEKVTREIVSHELRLEGVIDSSLFGAVTAAGGRPELAVRMAEIFQWDVDFLRDLRRGDTFTVLAEEQRVAGEFFDYGTIYAVHMVNNGRILDAIAYPDDNGRVGYYDSEGRALRKQFLRSPLKFSRITSRFSMRRFHPVLKRTMPHYGVDYGAPVGTPAHVTADGVVTFVGRNGGAGKMVTVRHPNGYETNYLHLSRYGSGIRKGVRVTQGQVIGHVGSTGHSTGPHLDYRVKLNGRWINPLSISSPPTQPLSPERMPRFLAHALAIISVLGGNDTPIGATC